MLCPVPQFEALPTNYLDPDPDPDHLSHKRLWLMLTSVKWSRLSQLSWLLKALLVFTYLLDLPIHLK